MQNEVTTTQNKPTTTISNEKFFKVYSPANCMLQGYKLPSLSAAINQKAPSLGAIRRDYGQQACESYIMVWLVYLNEMLSLSRPMSEEQIRLCATYIITDHNYLSVAELTFIFKRILSGHYGEFYERLGIDKILKFFREYDKERFALIVEEREREHAEFRYQEQANETPIEIYKRCLKKVERFF